MAHLIVIQNQIGVGIVQNGHPHASSLRRMARSSIF